MIHRSDIVLGQSQSKEPLDMQELSLSMAKFFVKMSSLCISEIQNRLSGRKLTGKQKIEEIHDDNSQERRSRVRKEEEDQSSNNEQQSQHGQINGDNEAKAKVNIFKKPEKPTTLIENRPKIPTSSYLIFLHHKKGDISKQYNTTNQKEVAKLSSIEWKKLSAEERQKYNALSQIEKDRYDRELKVYKQTYKDEITQYNREKQAYYRRRHKHKKESSKLKETAKSREKGLFNDSESLSSEHEIRKPKRKRRTVKVK